MAMIKCPECGHEISDSAVTCPNCGFPLNLKKEIPVTVRRLKKSTASLCKFVVYVDGMMAGELKNGQEMTINVSQGNHELSVESISVLGLAQTSSTGPLIIPDNANKVTVEIFAAFTGIKFGDMFVE